MRTISRMPRGARIASTIVLTTLVTVTSLAVQRGFASSPPPEYEAWIDADGRIDLEKAPDWMPVLRPDGQPATCADGGPAIVPFEPRPDQELPLMPFPDSDSDAAVSRTVVDGVETVQGPLMTYDFEALCEMYDADELAPEIAERERGRRSG